MANPGRPAERPLHLSPEQRQRAKAQTAAWRRQAGLSQEQMARQIPVGYSTYRAWESGNDAAGGPSRQQAAELNLTLCRLLRGGYSEGQAQEAWGWPTERDMDYEQVSDLLRGSGFIVPGLRGEPRPETVFWMHRVRKPNLIHAVFALAAAAASRAGLSVCLVLDDIDVPVQHGDADHLAARIGSWFEFGGGRSARLTVRTYSEILTRELVARRGWATAEAYLKDADVLEFLRASKVVSPLDYSVSREDSVLNLVRQREPPRALQLLVPIRNWLVFYDELARLSGDRETPPSIVTLGGEDERILWELWHHGCPENFSDHVYHIYLRLMPMPSYQAPWQEDALLATTSRPLLAKFLSTKTQQDGNADLMEWIVASAIGMPTLLNPRYGSKVSPVLTKMAGLASWPAAQLPSAAPEIAAAVVEWLST